MPRCRSGRAWRARWSGTRRARHLVRRLVDAVSHAADRPRATLTVLCIVQAVVLLAFALRYTSPQRLALLPGWRPDLVHDHVLAPLTPPTSPDERRLRLVDDAGTVRRDARAGLPGAAPAHDPVRRTRARARSGRSASTASGHVSADASPRCGLPSPGSSLPTRRCSSSCRSTTTDGSTEHCRRPSG